LQRTRSLPHDQGEVLRPLLVAYRNLLNDIISEIWQTLEWNRVPTAMVRNGRTVVPTKQFRLFPHYLSSREFKRALRAKCIRKWRYAAHWADSAEDTAFSIVRSWKKNHDKGDRSRRCPIVTRLFARVKQDLCKLEGTKLRITVAPREFVWIDLSRRFFKLPDKISPFGLGEPSITLEMIHLPIFRREEIPDNAPELLAWDSNFESFDGFSPQSGWLKIDVRPLSSVHDNSSAKLGSIKKKFGRSVKGIRLVRKYRHRELNRAKKHQIEIARVMRGASKRIVFEALRKKKLLRGRSFNYRLARTDWRGIANLAGERVEEVSPWRTSKNCSRCGWTNKDLNRAKVFECMRCGLRVDRQLNACIGIYERAEGVPYEKEWWDNKVLPSLVGGYFQSGAETRATNELVRSLYETVKPQVEYRYDRYNDAYLS
jgi:putative transposase